MFKLIYIFIINFSFAIEPSCDLWSLLGTPEVVKHEKFWEEYAKLKEPENFEVVRGLLKKHNLDKIDNKSTSIVEVMPRTTVIYKSHVDKKLKVLPPKIRESYDEFLAEVEASGIESLYKKPGKWHLEKLYTDEGGDRTVRLNGGYRLKFSTSSDGRHIDIYDVGKHVTH